MSARDVVAQFIGKVWGPLGAEDHADAILAALAAAGYKVLGREPTPEMVYAGSANCLDWDQADEWRAMFDAAQPATEQKE